MEIQDKPNNLTHKKELQDLELDRTRVRMPYLPFIDGNSYLTPLIRIIMGLQSQAEIFALYSLH